MQVGADAVVETGAMLDGHYLEFLRFHYNTLRCVPPLWGRWFQRWNGVCDAGA